MTRRSATLMRLAGAVLGAVLGLGLGAVWLSADGGGPSVVPVASGSAGVGSAGGSGSGAAYRPFLDPLDLHEAWWLTLLPLALGISLSYKAVRVGSLRELPKQVVVMTVQVVVGMALLAAATYAIVELAVPWLEG